MLEPPAFYWGMCMARGSKVNTPGTSPRAIPGVSNSQFTVEWLPSLHDRPLNPLPLVEGVAGAFAPLASACMPGIALARATCYCLRLTSSPRCHVLAASSRRRLLHRKADLACCRFSPHPVKEWQKGFDGPVPLQWTGKAKGKGMVSQRPACRLNRRLPHAPVHGPTPLFASDAALQSHAIPHAATVVCGPLL